MAQAAEEKKEIEAGGLIKLHVKARTTPYPQTADKPVERFKVPDDKVPWKVPFADYKPPFFTHQSVLKNKMPDDSLEKMKYFDPHYRWNKLEKKRKGKYKNAPIVTVDRRSHHGKYKLDDEVHEDLFVGIPMNPMGRTGLIGRGLLWRWGPNHAADPIVTRWKREGDEPSGKVVTNKESGKPVLEFIAIERKDGGGWAIPGGMVDMEELCEERIGGKVSMTLAREFGEEAMDSLGLSAEEKEKVASDVDAFFSAKSVEIYKGYCDDPRNTDHAWLETTACNFHDDDGSTVGSLKLKAGDDAGAVKWMQLSGDMELYASHKAFLERVANMHKAHW